METPNLNKVKLYRTDTTVWSLKHTNEYKSNWGELSKINGLYPCQYPRHNVILYFCKMLPLGETGQSVQGIFYIISHNYKQIYNYFHKNFN